MFKNGEFLTILTNRCDQLLRDPVQQPEAIESVASQIITLLKFSNEKDVFQKAYGKLLARRLLLGSSVSLEHENIFVKKLQVFFFLGMKIFTLLSVTMWRVFCQFIPKDAL